MSETAYYQPGSMDELRALLPSLPDNTAILAGGTDLMIIIRNKHPQYDAILSLWRLDELRQITLQDGYLKIGAMVTHQAAVDSPDVAKYYRALHQACDHVGSQQVRNKGTLAGSLMNASPAGDILPCVLLFDGKLELLGREGVRVISADELYGENGKPHLSPCEVLTGIWLPVREDLHSAFLKLGSRTEVTIAQISLCSRWTEEAGKLCIEKAYAGAIDRRPWPFPDPQLLGRSDTAEEAAQVLSGRIREIRLNRKRPPKLKITEAERLYKERAAKGVAYDLMTDMGVLRAEEEESF